MKSVLFGSDNSSPEEDVVSYNCINAVVFSSWSTNQSLRNAVVPGPMTLSNYYLQTDVAPGIGSAYAFTVMKNGAATLLEVVIADTATSGINTTNTISFAAGDTISLRCTPIGTPASLSVQSWNIITETSNQTAPLMTVSGPASTSATSYGVITGGQATASGWNATESNMQIVVPTSGTISNLYALASAAPGNGKSWQYTLMLNGAATDLQATVLNTVANGNDTTHSVSVVAGDTISMRCVPTGSPTSSTPAFSAVFTPTIDGESFFGFGHPVAPLAGTSYEQPLGLGTNAWSANESNRPMTFGPHTITKMYVKLTTPPGVGASRTFTLRRAAASTPLVATISDTSTAASSVSDVTFTQGQQITLQSTSTGSPAAATGGVHAGFLVYIAPDSVPSPVAFVPQIMIY